MIVYESKLFKLPFIRNYIGITLSENLILFRDSKEKVHEHLANHEKGHEVQYAVLDTTLVPGKLDAIMIFWITYIFSYLWNLAKYKNHWMAYKNIIWERLAREFEDV